MRTRTPWLVVAVTATTAATTLIMPPAAAAPGTPAPSDKSTGATDARSEARRTGKQVEVAAARTEYEQVYANPDGSYTSELYAYPQATRGAT